MDPDLESLIHLYDWEDAVYDLPFYVPRETDEKGRPHFKMTLTYQRMLVVQCLLTRRQSHFPNEIRTLLPYCKGEEGPLKVIKEEALKQAGCQTFDADFQFHLQN